MRRQGEKRVALAFPQGLVFLGRILTGIVNYAKRGRRWTFTAAPEAIRPSFDWLRHWPGDGAFVLVLSRADARLARQLPMPVVNLVSWLPDSGVPSVSVDHEGIGRLAAQYFLGRRFQRLGFYGTRGPWFSELRCRGFEAAVRAAGRDCSTLLVEDPAGPSRKWTDQQEAIRRWLKAQRPPVGILASTDRRARMVVEACAALGRRVPEDVAVLGVDNDPIVCEFANLPLSSVSRNDPEVGARAAALLDRLMRGAAAPEGPILVPPGGIVQRRSTETLAIEDPQIAAAVQFIGAHRGESFGVKQLLGHVGLSRRRLEHRFRECLGCTPYHFINRVRVDHAKELLAGPQRLTFSAIAAACGFSDLRRFRLVFRRFEGITPAQYRGSLKGEDDARDPPAD